ncbi:hypothetical protein PRZ48_003881 [Zasmidium cellare]|uniref:Endonuclease/exonuclease/phosphatase domain-containing protein n=1 Tax=Zasmidium cellare TaxID=395010 RepID=A0ABR0EXN5_ZASCE|nr:hypothetical protein PRZ48_003881 [Zasmidium cellare]
MTRKVLRIGICMLHAFLLWQLTPAQATISPQNMADINVNTTGPVSFPLRIITHNTRYATSSPFKGEKPWPDRRPLIISELLHQTRFLDGQAAPAGSFICLQEVLHQQLQDILSGLNDSSDSEWQHIGIGREDGMQKGEYSPILYPTRIFKLLNFKNIWLSPTPDKPSKGWDAGSERILTIGVFENRHTGQRFMAANTHLDNEGSVAREKSVDLILETLEDVRREWAQVPYFLAGDFNSFPTQEAYKAMIASGQVADVYSLVPEALHFGDENTFTGFQPDTDEDKDGIGRIDFVWLGPKSAIAGEPGNREPGNRESCWIAKGYSVIPNVFDAGVFASDHRAVVADVVMR